MKWIKEVYLLMPKNKKRLPRVGTTRVRYYGKPTAKTWNSYEA